MTEQAELTPCRSCLRRRDRRLVRGLCPTCRDRHSREGTLEEVALPKVVWNKAVGADRPVGELRTTPEGYMQRWDGNRWLSEHRWVMEQHLGRPLARGENVHHLNGVRDDNLIENLELWFSPQPYGQRVTDLIAYVVEHHMPALREAIAKDQP